MNTTNKGVIESSRDRMLNLGMIFTIFGGGYYFVLIASSCFDTVTLLPIYNSVFLIDSYSSVKVQVSAFSEY